MDEELIRQACRGDREAAGRLYERHSSRVYAIVRRLAGNDDQARDWAQEAWLRVFRGLGGFRGEASFTTWLHRIAVNTALQGRRGNRRRHTWLDEVSEIPETASRPYRPLLRLSLQRALDELPTGMRTVVVLHDIEGYTHAEIGEMLGVSAGTCKSQLFKARGKLRTLMEPSSAVVEGERVCST